MIRSLKNKLAPIHRIPPEVLTLVPDYWGEWKWNKVPDVIPLTHVCRAWREMFLSRSSLWTTFYCKNADKTRAYLERSRSSPIELQINREDVLSPHDPLLQVIPHATSRLKHLSVRATPKSIDDITIHLSRPAPLLEFLSVDYHRVSGPASKSTLPPSLFNGDLSSLRTLHLLHVRTELPWRNMANLTSFVLWGGLPGESPIGQLLDFFESAPSLKSVELISAIPASGAQSGRLVSLGCLEWMVIQGREPCPHLLNHLLIPVGATLSIRVTSLATRPEDHLPRPPSNLRNLSNLTRVSLNFSAFYPELRFTGPNGELSVTFLPPQPDFASPVLEFLAKLDTSGIEQLALYYADDVPEDFPQRAFLHMNNLRIFTLYPHHNSRTLIRALYPDTGSSGAVFFPKLEELNLVLIDKAFDIKSLANVARARKLGGAKLKTVRIVDRADGIDPGGVLKLREHVSDVECGPGVIIDGGGGVE